MSDSLMDAILGDSPAPSSATTPPTAAGGQAEGTPTDAPAQPDPSPADSPALADPGQGGGFNWIFGGGDGGDTTDASRSDAGDGEQPDGGQQSQGDGGDAPDIDSLFSKAVPELPDFLKDGDSSQIDSWKKMRETTSGLTHQVAALQIELAEARKGGGTGEGDGAQPMPESDAVKALQAQIAQLKPAAQQWQEEEARRGIGESVAFRKEFDAPRSAILRELTTAAKKAGIENPESAAEEYLRLETEYDQSEWIADNFEEEDGRPAKFFGSKGKEFRDLTERANGELSAPDPISRLKDWQEYEAAFSTKFAATMGDAIQQQFRAAFPRVRSQLLDQTSGDPLYFGTESGVKALQDITERIESGTGIAPEEVLAGLASIDRANTYQALATRLAAQVQDLRKQLGTSARVEPGSQFQQDPPPDGGNASPDNMPSFGAGKFQPLVSPEQLAGALR